MFRKIVGAIGGIRDELVRIEKILRINAEAAQTDIGYGALAERVASLEGDLERVLGQVEAGLTRAEALKATARAAEDRARGHLKRAEKFAEIDAGGEAGEDQDPFAPGAAELGPELHAGNDMGGEGVSPVPHGMEGRRSALQAIRQIKRRG